MRPRWKILLVGLILAPALFALRGWYLPAVAHWLDVGERPIPKVDYAIVLPGDYTSRPFVAAALYRAGLARSVATPSPEQSPENVEGVALPEPEITRRVLLKLGVPPEDVVILPGASQSTFDDARLVAKLVAGRPHTSIAVVTSDYHTRRSRWIFRRVLGGLPVEIHMVAAPTDYYSADDWWRYEAGFSMYCAEYMKFGYYLLRYEPATWWILGACGLGLFALLFYRRANLRRSGLAPTGASQGKP